MNGKIDLTKILRDCPECWKFYSSVYGEVEFVEIRTAIPDYPVIFKSHGSIHSVSNAGEHFKWKGECTFFPSREQRDWSKFTAPLYKKERFDPRAFKPFDKVLVKNENTLWKCNAFSHIQEGIMYKYCVFYKSYKYCIPYNEDTKYLVGTTEEAPEYYRYWED